MARQIRVSKSQHMTFFERLSRFGWPLFIIMALILTFSMIMLYSAGSSGCAGNMENCTFGAWRPYALSQLGKIAIALIVFFIAAFSDIKTWLRSSYALYAGALILVLLVTFVGHTGMGAQRWLNLGFFSIQPSELIKIGLVLALARYFAWMNSVELERHKNYWIPAAMVGVPFLLIMAQPDLGTAVSLAFIALGFFYIVGAQRKWFMILGILGILAAPALWFGGLHDYQRARITTFMDPTADLQGAGYQINQAKIAFGSGGIIGKGYLSGTQSQLSFLPEKQTDFIFTMMGEEFGFIGGFILIFLYSAMTAIIFWYAKTCRNRFGQLVCFGFCLNFFVYYFINIAMVLGLMPTVGVPLPLVSFGGSSLLALMFGLGLVQNAHINKDQQLSAGGA
ncbi:MAG: rod shape-determining protein RodA [Alphaproteobacteria bacterium]|nr:rod shape-determining protein RodA [Alphaproteobacteria bacterium]MCL2889637.1 rod shape-determining protein RodA [Alphaproteobacteria bacterium]